MPSDALESNPSRKDPPYGEPQPSFRPHVAVDALKAANPEATIRGSDNTKREELDKSHRIRHNAKAFFKPGRMFALLWHESAAFEAGSLVAAASSAAVMTRFGERVFNHIRRTVVVRETHRHCRWISIKIYNGMGRTEDAEVVQRSQTADSVLDRLVSHREAHEPPS